MDAVADGLEGNIKCSGAALDLVSSQVDPANINVVSTSCVWAAWKYFKDAHHDVDDAVANDDARHVQCVSALS